MDERRRSKRLELKSTLIMKRVDNGGEGGSQEVTIEITDVSKSGVGFACLQPLRIGAVYESYLTIWTKEVIHAFLQIVRIELGADNRYCYGASFVGMPEMEANRIEVYQTLAENSQDV